MARKRVAVDPGTTPPIVHGDYLDHLLGGEGAAAARLVEAPVDTIDPNPHQPRREFGEAGLKELAQSMQTQGFFGHLLARRAGRRYQLAYGERRLRAARQAGLATVPLAVHELTDDQMLALAITENVQRQDLNPMEEAEGYRRLQEMGFSLRQIAARVGKSAGHISMLLSVLAREDVAQAVRDSGVQVRIAHEVARVEDGRKRRRLLRQARRGELTRGNVRQAVEEASRSGVPARRASAGGRPASGSPDPRPALQAALKAVSGLGGEGMDALDSAVRQDAVDLLRQIRDEAARALAESE